MKTLIVASLIFLFISVGGVVAYLYFIAEPKRHGDEPATSTKPNASKPVDKDLQVPLPDAGPSEQSPQPQQKQIQELPKADPEPATPQELSIPEPPSQPVDVRKPVDVPKPVLIHRVNPEYPEVARKGKIQGLVILEVVITKDGKVENVKVLRGVHPLLDQAAVNAVKKWRYKPLIQNVHSTVTVNFKLK